MDKNDFRKDIKKDLKIMKRNKVVSALLFVVLGVVLLAWPAETLQAVSRLVGLVLTFGGIAAVVMYFVNSSQSLFSYAGLAGGVIIAVIGLWLFFNPGFLVQLIPTIIGLMLVISGLVNLSESYTIHKEHGEGVRMAVSLAAVTILLGILIFALQERFSWLITRLMGIALVYDGVSDLLIISRITGVVKTVEFAMDQAAREAAALDVTDTVTEKEAPAQEEEKESKRRFHFPWLNKSAKKDIEIDPQNMASPEDFVEEAEETTGEVTETLEETIVEATGEQAPEESGEMPEENAASEDADAIDGDVNASDES